MLYALEVLKKLQQKSWQRYHRIITNLRTRAVNCRNLCYEYRIGYGNRFGHVLANKMKHSESIDLDRLSKVHGELDELKDIMVKKYRQYSDAWQTELLVNKTENLSANSVIFRKTSRNFTVSSTL